MTTDCGTLRQIGPVAINIGNHTASWSAEPTSYGARSFQLSGSLREPATGRQLVELIDNPARRINYGDYVGVLEWIEMDGEYADFRGWALLESCSYSDGPADTDSDAGWAPFSINAVAVGDVDPVLIRAARALSNDFEIVPRSLAVQPLEGEDAMGHPFLIDPAAGAGLVLVGERPLQGFGTDGGVNGLAGTGDIGTLTGDLSIRVAFIPHEPDQVGGDLVGQWRDTTQHGYLLELNEGKLRGLWSTNGSNTLFVDSVDLGLRAGDSLIARWDLDVSTRAHTFKRKRLGRGSLYSQMFSESGWTTFDEVDESGSTSINDSTTGLKVGGYLDANVLSRSRFSGRILAAMVVDGLDTDVGTVKAAPDFSIQPSATTAFIDQVEVLWIVDNNEVAFIGSQPFDREYDPRTEYEPELLTALGRRLRLHQGKVA